MLPAESTTSPVVSLRVPTMLPAESTTVPVVASSVPTMCAGGVHHHRAVHGRGGGGVGGVGVGGVGGRRSRRRGQRRLASAGVASVPSAGAASAPPVTVSDWSIVLSWMPVAIASAATCLVDHDTLVGQRLRGRSRWRGCWRSRPRRSAPRRWRSGRRRGRWVRHRRSRGRCPPRGRGSRRPPCPVAQSPPRSPAPRASTVRTRRVLIGSPSLAPGTSCRGSSHGPMRPCSGRPHRAIGPSGPVSPMTLRRLESAPPHFLRDDDPLTTAHWHDPVPPGRLPGIGVAPPSGGLPCRLDIGLYPVPHHVGNMLF